MKNKLKLSSFFIVTIAMLFTACEKKGIKPDSLTVSEGFENPIGFYDNEPSFSWKLPVNDEVKFQSAYRIVVASDPKLLPGKADLWDTKKIDSDQSVWLRYDGIPLKSRQKVYWQIMFWDQSGKKSEWSDKAYFELGLLNNSDWNAKWIGLKKEENPDTTDAGYEIIRPQYLRKEFNLEGKIKQARLYITSKGVFEARINGEKVGDDVMSPGWTPYERRIETLTYDVTDYLNKGDNAIGIILAEGWYSGRIRFRKQEMEKPQPMVICQLEILYKNGDKKIVASDADWKGTRQGPIRFAGIYDGEIYDANLEMPGWSSAGINTENWIAVESGNIEDNVNLSPKRHHAVTAKRELLPLKISEPESGKYVFDLGQNMVGVPELNIPVKKGHKVTIRFAEMLQDDGKIYTENYRSAKSTDYYIPKADGYIRWHPRFTFHGFRYVELSGFNEDNEPVKEWVKGIVQYSDFKQSGIFKSSHDKLNKLQSNIVWGLWSNFFDVPTDCPQRDERLGWTGDAQVFAPTSIFNSGVHAFWSAWLQSVREEQFENGGIPYVVPNVLGKSSSSGWADAATVIPWEIYYRTGDKELLQENYHMMKRLVGYYRSKSENYIADVNSFGDWLQPFPAKKDNTRGDTPKDLIGTAYFAHSTDLTLKAAKVLGYKDDVMELQSLRDSIRLAFEKEFLNSEGKLTTEHETQTGYLMALGFNLVSDEMAKKVLPYLIKQIHVADNHLRTGFLGTPLLAPVLDRYKRTDLMYEILFKETYPSWFYSINQGATTMWERWNSYSHEEGFGKASMNSFNHYAYGAIGQWMYERIAGISPLEAGYKKILIAPVPGKQLEYASGEYNSVYGKISSAWEKVNDGLRLEVTIPPNTTSQIVIPIKEGASIKLDGEDIENRSDIKVIERNSYNVVVEVVPGSYVFTTNN